jgi:hypothetical protein
MPSALMVSGFRETSSNPSHPASSAHAQARHANDDPARGERRVEG